MGRTERAHQKFREGLYEEALHLYSSALSLAKLTHHRIALHSNRAACYLKLKNFTKAVEECSAVLELDALHTGALMLRVQALVVMKDYHSAILDVDRLIATNPFSNTYHNLQARLMRRQQSLARIPEGDDKMTVGEAALPEGTSSDTLGTLSVGLALKGWDAIPKPKGHSGLDYSQWDSLVNQLSDDEDVNGDSQPQFKFRLKTVDLQTVDQR